jgi:hypothetical protein
VIIASELDDDEEEEKSNPRKESGKGEKERAAKGIRFKAPVEEKTKAKLPERLYVLVPPLKTKPLAPFIAPLRKDGKTAKPTSTPLPVLEKTHSYKNKAPIEDDEALRRIVEELINTKFTTSLKDLASVSAPAQEYLKKMITRRKVAQGEAKASDLEYQIISLMDLWTQPQEEKIVQFLNLLDDEDVREEEGPVPEPETDQEELVVFSTFVQLEVCRERRCSA